MSDNVNLTASREDTEIILKIVERASSFHKIDRITVSMDLTACHLNGNPLKLQELLDADDFDFIHDVFGITRRIDRDTGKLTDFFSPRYSKR